MNFEDLVENWPHIFKVKKHVFGSNVYILACIRSVCRMFIVRFVSEKPKGDKVYGLSFL